jgi:hypothetical protein
MIGTASNTYTAPGITSVASRSAQSGPLSVVTTDASGNLASDGGQIFSELNRAFRKIEENTQGVAIAIAMGGLHLPDSKQFALGASFGTFDGKSALAAQSAIRLSPNLALTSGVGFGVGESAGSTKVGARVGLQASW